MQKFYFSKVLGAGSIIAVIMLTNSCVSHPPKYDTQAFGAIGTEADMYVFAPVYGNEPLLQTVLTAFVPEKTAAQYLDRTSALYIGAEYGAVPSVTVISTGSYPTSLGDLLFSKKDGWEKHKATALSNTSYYSSAVADILMRERTAFMLLGTEQRNTAAFLQHIADPHPPIFPPRFQALPESGSIGEIGLYTRSGSLLITAMLGLDGVDLPIRSIELYLKKNIDSVYQCSAAFEAVDARSALVIRLLLSRSMAGEFSVQGSSVFVENADITEKELIKLLQGVFAAYHF